MGIVVLNPDAMDILIPFCYQDIADDESVPITREFEHDQQITSTAIHDFLEYPLPLIYDMLSYGGVVSKSLETS